ncbi:MAG TPA: hypothetical protein VNZ52_12415, partial [Candidatus Thermoplasmatota archaeon]|nr:hypothetical protein [Candidatus Thermoplasmatota archaeon]
PVNAYVTTFEVREDAKYLHIGFKDLRPQVGTLRAAWISIEGPGGEYAGGVADDLFAEAYLTTLRGPGTYTAYLLTDGGLASEYQLTLDVHYPQKGTGTS